MRRGDGPIRGRSVAIVPLMHRHEVEPADALTHTTMRHGRRRRADPGPADGDGDLLRRLVPRRLRDDPGRPGGPAGRRRRGRRPTSPSREAVGRWDVVDLRRLRCGDPAGRRAGRGLRRARDRQGLDAQRGARGRLPGRDARPTAPTWTTTSSTLGKKERHEIRRKVRRAEAVGEVRLEESPPTRSPTSTPFIDLHQKRWGADGLFPPTPGGDAEPGLLPPAVRAVRAGRAAPAVLPDGRRPADRRRHPLRDARRLPLLQRRRRPRRARAVAGRPAWSTRYVARALAAGRRRFDFLRGNEPYKYEWGAVDEPIQRLLVRRRTRLT